MDRSIAPSERRRAAIRRALASLVVVASAAVSLGAFHWWLQPSVERARIRTAVVTRGPLEVVIEASGTVVPAYEKVLTSPVETRIVRVLRRPGDLVAVGDPIVELDTSAVELELARLGERLAQKRNERAQAEVALDRRLAGLRGERALQALDQEMRELRAARDRRLHAEGLLIAEKLKESEVALRKGQVELEQLDEAMAGERRATAALIDGLEIAIEVLRRERQETVNRLQRASCRADRAGVLTWVYPDDGAAVGRGATLARIADLAAFRVVATASDMHAAHISVGLPVRVVIDDARTDGRVASIDPTIDGGRMRFEVALDEPNHPALRNNLRVDALVVTDRRPAALMVAKGPFAHAGGLQPVFVIDNGRAIRTPVRLGLVGYRAFEVVDGLAEGDEVIISDTSDHRHVAELRLR